jgi:hypothetical protein
VNHTHNNQQSNKYPSLSLVFNDSLKSVNLSKGFGEIFAITTMGEDTVK